ncbi:TrkH family potassium uptake protein [Pelagibacterales bacterium SAG-MED05]|nr:TrkH family potassium uptake protein [Pelagibacterales bacterium SAG-MED05]
MNFKGISYYLSLFCFPISILAFINILYSSYFDYFLSINSYLITLIVSFLTGSGLLFIGKKSQKRINFIEQLLLIVLVYLIIPVLIALPFYLSNYQVTFLNSIFESISGLTGTGFSVFSNIKYLDPTLILWRSSSQWIGGLYFLFFLILIFSNKQFRYKMNDLTYSGDVRINSESNIKDLLLKIFILYSTLSFIIFLLLNISEVRMFNSLNLSMSLISAGGFIPTDSLGKIIRSNPQKLVFILSLLISMLNFFLILNIFQKKIIIREHKEDFYLITLSVFFILLVYLNNYSGLNIIISVLSSLSNSGLSLINSNNNLSLYFILISIVGGSLISNTSGIKFMRIYVLLKTASTEIIKLISPNSIINKNIFDSEKKITDDNIKISFLIFISFFISLFILSGILIVDNIGFEKSFKLSILTITNTTTSAMFGIEDMNFANLLTTSKISLIIFMIIGKIELISFFLIIKKIFFKD